MVATRRILVVDDEPLVTKSCRRILSLEGDQVETADTGREGLRRALEEHFDLVMTDLRMPDLDGMEIVRTLKRERPGVGIVIITGFGTIPTAVAATKLGVADFIEKPFTPDQILEAVNKALTSKEAPPVIEADAVRAVLKQAGEDPAFGRRLLAEGSRALGAAPAQPSLSPQARAAIASGDIAWIEKECGPLSPTERDWLQRRLQAEAW